MRNATTSVAKCDTPEPRKREAGDHNRQSVKFIWFFRDLCNCWILIDFGDGSCSGPQSRLAGPSGSQVAACHLLGVGGMQASRTSVPDSAAVHTRVSNSVRNLSMTCPMDRATEVSRQQHVRFTAVRGGRHAGCAGRSCVIDALAPWCRGAGLVRPCRSSAFLDIISRDVTRTRRMGGEGLYPPIRRGVSVDRRPVSNWKTAMGWPMHRRLQSLSPDPDC